jgi:alpha-beta hydrolase superfamily lysophospholipase
VGTSLESQEGLRNRNIQGEPLWILTDPEPIYAVLHSPEQVQGAGTAVLILPPFGWDNDCSYRSRREWAAELAQTGFMTLRIDLPGTEESLGTGFAPGRYQTWLDAIEGSAHWLREHSDCSRLVALGTGLGGYLACEAAAAGAPIDDLILWGVHARGRTFVREVRAYSDVVAAGLESEPDKQPRTDVLEIGGHPLTIETVEAISAIRLDELELPQAGKRRALLIERDAHGVDRKLRAHLEQSGVEVTVAPSNNEYEESMTIAELSVVPWEVIGHSIRWLSQPASEALEHRSASTKPRSAQEIRFERGGRMVRERLTTVQTPRGRLVGIIAEPADDVGAPLCVVSVNAGALRRTGPNRMMPRISRRAAAAGFTAARFDLPGLGDSDGTYTHRTEHTDSHEAESVEMMRRILDHVQAESNARRFAAVGICSGAYWGMRTALADQRTIAGIVANLAMFEWTPRHAELAEPPGFDPTQPSSTPAQTRLGRLLQPAAGKLLSSHRQKQAQLAVLHMNQWRAVRRVLNGLIRNNTRMLFVFSQNEPMFLMLRITHMAKRLANAPNMNLVILPTRDHDLRPLWVQEHVLGLVEEAVEQSSAAEVTVAASDAR